MKLLKVLLLSSLLALFSGAALASDDDSGPFIGNDDLLVSPVPEPSAALIMVAGLVTVAATRRLARRR